MELNEGIEELTRMFKDREWFSDVGLDQYGRLVVYTKFTCHETLHDIPDKIAGRQVLCHFASSKTATREHYVIDGNHKPFAKPLELVYVAPTKVEESHSDDLSHLISELDRLEKICGSNALQDIFYEVHDGKNAVTNLSERFGLVREDLQRLYDEYGFDVIYDEMDG